MKIESISGMNSAPVFRPPLRSALNKEEARTDNEDRDRKYIEEQEKSAEELKRRQEQLQKEKEQEQELDMLEKQLEASRKEAESMEDMYEAFSKCIKIAARISKGDIVPMKDMKYLAEHEPDMYKQAILMRMPNDKPKKHKSLVDDEDENTDEIQSSGDDAAESSADDIAPSSGNEDTQASPGEEHAAGAERSLRLSEA